jgi:hypothetical protein
MIIKASQNIIVFFSTINATTGAAEDADSLPTGVLYENGSDSGEVITISNVDTGLYSASFSIPSDAAEEDVYDLVVEGTVNGVAGIGSIWRGSISAVINFPAGAEPLTYTVTDTVSSDPVSGVDVWISTDLPGTIIIWRGTTDAFGVARNVNDQLPMLDPGTYYVWKQIAGYVDDDNPDTVVVA